MTEEKGGEKKAGNIIVILKGFIIGGTMLVPGVSGGSMAIILNIYDNLISAVSSFRKNKRGNLVFLLIFSAGGCLGMFLLARPLLHIIDTRPLASMYFFLGAVVGGVPLIVKKSCVEKLSWKNAACVLSGAAVVFAISMLHSVMPWSGNDGGAGEIIFLAPAGFIAAAAMILPGISLSYLLLIMGLYDDAISAISLADLSYLIPLGAGILLGTVLTAKLLEKLINTFPRATYLTILGFILGSLAEIFPGIPAGNEIFLCIFTFLAGCGSILLLSKKENA